MKIIVMKFGGTSVANVSKLKNVAKIVKANYKKNSPLSLKPYSLTLIK